MIQSGCATRGGRFDLINEPIIVVPSCESPHCVAKKATKAIVASYVLDTIGEILREMVVHVYDATPFLLFFNQLFELAFLERFFNINWLEAFYVFYLIYFFATLDHLRLSTILRMIWLTFK